MYSSAGTRRNQAATRLVFVRSVLTEGRGERTWPGERRRCARGELLEDLHQDVGPPSDAGLGQEVLLDRRGQPQRMRGEIGQRAERQARLQEAPQVGIERAVPLEHRTEQLREPRESGALRR